jgi:hypothetical protein
MSLADNWQNANGGPLGRQRIRSQLERAKKVNENQKISSFSPPPPSNHPRRSPRKSRAARRLQLEFA